MAWYARPALLVVLLALAIHPAGAQSFLDSLFGSDEQSASRPAGGYVRMKPAPSVFDGMFSPSGLDTPQPHVRGGTSYRTLCVRMCDGFYFPISHATSSSNFAQDAEKCSATCGDARLFYYPNPGGDIEGMLDLTGRAYASYPTAFRYRKKLVEGCQCRPQPWTEAEQARHRAYAAASRPGSAEAQTEAVAAPQVNSRNGFEDSMPRGPGAHPAFNSPPGYPRFSAQGDLSAVARPTPVLRQSQSGQWEWFSGNDSPNQSRSRYRRPDTR